MKNITYIAKAVFVIAYLYVGAANADIFTLDVTADIDGRSDLIVTGNRLMWQQFEWGTVGLYNPNYPSTILTTTVNGVTVLNNYAWTPIWPSTAVYGNYGNFSSTFTGLNPGAPVQQNMSVALTVEQARYSLTLVQHPSSSNGYTTIVEFNDNPPGGDDLYRAKLTFMTSAVPEPEEWAMLMVGIPLVGWKIRRKQRGEITRAQ